MSRYGNYLGNEEWQRLTFIHKTNNMIKLIKTLGDLKTIQTFAISKKIDSIPHLYVAFCGNCNYAKEMSNLIEVLNKDGISYEIVVLSV